MMSETQIPAAAQRHTDLPDAAEFAQTLGQVTWLMGLSDAHLDVRVRDIESRIQTPLMLKQVRVFTKGKQPLAAVVWATVSGSIQAALAHPSFKMELAHWRSGPEVVIIDVISPFVARKKIETMFWEQIKEARRQADATPAQQTHEGEV